MKKSNDTESTRRKENLPKSEKVKDAKLAPVGASSKIAGRNRNGNSKFTQA